ncbi:MAG: tetratricopeptide repeat protein [Nitrospinales bacterium]
MSRKNKESEKLSSGPPSSTLKKLAKPLAGAALLVALVVGLIYTAEPPGNLEPYDRFKASKVKQSTSPDEDASDEEKIAAEKRRELKALAKSSTDRTIALPKEAFIHIGNAMKFAEEQKFDASDDEFQKAAMISPDTPEIYSLWGVALRMAERYKEAEKRFSRAYELSPDNDEITFNFGMSQLHAEKTDDAIDLFKKTIKLNPKHHMAYNLLGKAYGKKQKFDLETAAYRKAIEIKPDFALAHFNLGIVLSIQKHFMEAVPQFEKAIELDKQYAKPFVTKFLKKYGSIRESMEAKQDSADAKQPQMAKLDGNIPSVAEVKKQKEKEGSGHSMEGSSADIEKETTNLSGKILVNGETIDTNAVVYLETKDKLPVPNQEKPKTLTIIQKGLQFVPQHSVVMVGSELKFVNNDKEPHNIYSKSLNNQFNLGAMAPGTAKTIKITDAGPITLRCNLHKGMIGTVFAAPNGYYTHPTETGDYFFKEVKSKEYFLQVWHPRLYPREVMEFSRSIGLIGKDKAIDFKIQSASKPDEIHDLVDETDYDAIVNEIETLVFQGIEAWKQGKKYLPRKRLLLAITKHYEGAGLKGAITKSFSEKRGALLEKELDAIRKKISGIKVDDKPVTEESLKHSAKLVISQLRANARELKARVHPLPE